MNMIRFFSSAARPAATSLLAQLRKKTGFALSNCRKALELCNNDLSKAEEWLRAEASRLGWEKAMKLQSRSASEGLIAVAKAKNKICMVEVNCETDFVAKNEKFVSLAQIVAASCLKYDISQLKANMKNNISKEELEDLSSPNQDKLKDFVALRIGEFGENIILRRGLIYEADEGVNVDVAVHPGNIEGQSIPTGRYGAFVAYKGVTTERIPEKIGINLCKHIIGFNPKNIGIKKIMESEPITKNEDVGPEHKRDEDRTLDNETDEDLSLDSRRDEDGLLNQNYILDPSVTVGEYLEEQGIAVVDFGRFECGEDNQPNVIQKQENEPEDSENRARSI